MKKTIFIVQGGLQRMNQNIENGSYSPLHIEQIEAPENVADCSFKWTNIWHTNLDSLVEGLREIFPELSICVSYFNDKPLLEFQP